EQRSGEIYCFPSLFHTYPSSETRHPERSRRPCGCLCRCFCRCLSCCHPVGICCCPCSPSDSQNKTVAPSFASLAKGGMYKFNQPVSIGYEIHPPRKPSLNCAEPAQVGKGTPLAKTEPKSHKAKRKDRHGTLCALSETLASSAFIFH